jgi:hypothetical protein
MKGVLPPEVLTVAEYDVPIVPLGKLAVVIFTCACAETSAQNKSTATMNIFMGTF